MAATPENKVKAALKKMFKKYEDDLYSFMPVQHGYGAAGLDFHCAYRGRAFFVEAKAPNGQLTPRQTNLMSILEEKGNPVFIVRCQVDIDRVEQWILRTLLLESATSTDQ